MEAEYQLTAEEAEKEMEQLRKVFTIVRLVDANRIQCLAAGKPSSKSQFLIVTHSPILLGIPGADIYCFDDGAIHRCAYEETESYQVTEMFVNNREALLRRLLEEEDN